MYFYFVLCVINDYFTPFGERGSKVRFVEKTLVFLKYLMIVRIAFSVFVFLSNVFRFSSCPVSIFVIIGERL